MKTNKMMWMGIVALGLVAPVVLGLSYNPELFTIESNYTGMGATDGYFTAGGYVVWWSTPSLELTGYDLAKRESFAVAPAGNVDATSPRINESYFIWWDYTAKVLYAFDLAKRERITVNTESLEANTLVLAGRYLCWLGTMDHILYGFDLAEREKFTIASGTIDTLNIRGAGHYLVYRTQTNPAWYGYDLSEREGFLIYANGMNAAFNKMNERAVILSSMNEAWLRGFDLNERQLFSIAEGDWLMALSAEGDTILWNGYMLYPGLWAYSINTGQSFQVSTDAVSDRYMKANERYVVWIGYDATWRSLAYGYDLLKGIRINTGVETMNPPLLAGSIFYREFTNPAMTTTEFRGYDLETGAEFSVAPVSNGGFHIPKANGDYLFWVDSTQPGTHQQLFAARIWNLPNDTCEDAVEVAAESVYHGDSSGAKGSDLTDCGSDDWRDVWHVFQASEGGVYTIDARSAAFDTTLAVFESCSGDAIVACNDNRDSKTGDSQLAVTLEKDQGYWIRVAGTNGTAGLYSLTVTRGSCGKPPQADLTGDCRVNLEDLAIVSAQWLDCGLVPAELCN